MRKTEVLNLLFQCIDGPKSLPAPVSEVGTKGVPVGNKVTEQRQVKPVYVNGEGLALEYNGTPDGAGAQTTEMILQI